VNFRPPSPLKVDGINAGLGDHADTGSRPLVDRIKGSRYHNMKELRPTKAGLRILFAFDKQQRAVVLVGGDKSGQWNR
jgi:hypothetical protein